MKVFLDKSPLVLPGFDRGLGRYTKGLMDALVGVREVDLQLVTGISKYTSKFSVETNLKNLSVIPSKNDIYHSIAPGNLPFIKRNKWVCSVLDLIPLDLPEYQRFGVKTRIDYNNALRSDAIVVLSQYTKSRLVEQFDVTPDSIWVNPLPLHSTFYTAPKLEEKNKQGNHFVLALVDLRAKDLRKRIHWVSQVFSALNKNGIATVVAGRQIEASMFPGSRIVENPTDEVLIQLFLTARGFYYPSAYEGQGMPPMEALNFGCPVVAYDNTSIREMLGSNAVVLKDPLPWENSSLTASLEESDLNDVIAIFEKWTSMPDIIFEIFRKELQSNLEHPTLDGFSNVMTQIYSELA